MLAGTRRTSTRRLKALCLILFLLIAGGAIALSFKLLQELRRDQAVLALSKYDAADKAITRAEIHQQVFGGSQPAAETSKGNLLYTERWVFTGIMETYYLDIDYLDVNYVADFARHNHGNPLNTGEPEQIYTREYRVFDVSRFDAVPPPGLD